LFFAFWIAVGFDADDALDYGVNIRCSGLFSLKIRWPISIVNTKPAETKAERTNFPSEVVEMALAHAVGDKKRRRLMAEWASYCNRPAASGRDKVVRMRGSR
jgi:hypothetical protein